MDGSHHSIEKKDEENESFPAGLCTSCSGLDSVDFYVHSKVLASVRYVIYWYVPRYTVHIYDHHILLSQQARLAGYR